MDDQNKTRRSFLELSTAALISAPAWAQGVKQKPLPPGVKSRSGNETGFGPPREVKQQAVRYEIEPPHDFVSVRYTR